MTLSNTDIDRAILASGEILDEYFDAKNHFPKFYSLHEGIAIIEEEFIELREEVFWGEKKGFIPESQTNHNTRLRKEVKQLGAMALALMAELTEVVE